MDEILDGIRTCPECKGEGFIEFEIAPPTSSPWPEVAVKCCPTCGGAGEIEEELPDG
jgi:DnaJ-class molecular chaperone